MYTSSDPHGQEKLVSNSQQDQRSTKKIASFEPRDQTMEVQNNHHITVCLSQETFFVNFFD
jgi:uncharacterized lipoprotein YajG